MSDFHTPVNGFIRKFKINTMSILKINVPNTLDKMVEISNLQSSPFDGKKWYVEVVCCENPTCDCENVVLVFRDEHQVNNGQYSFSINSDLAEEKFTKLNFNNDQGGDLSILSEPTMLLEELLTEEDWEKLITVHKVSKGVLIDEYDLKKVEADFPEELLKNPSIVVLFQDIFPLASYFYFDSNDNIPYTVLEQYCSNYKCNCSNVVLSFTKDGQNEDFAFRYNYKTKEIELSDSCRKDISLEKVKNYIQLLKTKFKDFDRKLEKRHEIMRHLFKKFTIRMNTKLVSTNKRIGQKIGRNAPCPCGSGKKYKKCCG